MKKKLALRFDDVFFEYLFRTRYDAQVLPTIRIALLTGCLLYGLFGILDTFIVPEVKHAIWIIRYGIVCPLFITVFLLSYKHSIKPKLQLLVSLCIAVGGLGIVVMIVLAPSPGDHLYYAGLILLPIYGYTFVRLRFVYAFASCTIIVLAYEIAVIFIKNTPLPIIISNNFFYIASNLLCMFAGYTMEKQARANVLQLHTREQDQEELLRFNSELEQLSQSDHLTGLYNRRYLDARLHEAIAYYRRYKHPVSILFLDLDDFKQVNDRLGHYFGDSLLQQVAEKIKGNALRATDVAFRYGGDEFCILLPNTTLEESKEIGKRLGQLLEEIRLPEAVEIAISFSAGCLALTEELDTTDKVIRKADDLLYRAKHSGKGCIVT